MSGKTYLLLSLTLLFCSSVAAQTPVSAKRHTNDSGYVSPYLPVAKANRVQGGRGSEKELDNPRARQEALRESRGGNPLFRLHALKEASRERAQFAHLMPTATSTANANSATAASSAVPHWVNIGPTKNDYIQNGVTLHVTDSGRMRSILVNPENPDVVYLLTSSGGL